MSTVRRNKRGKQDERNRGGWYLTNIRPIHSVLESGLVLWAKQETNGSDIMWTVPGATFMQAFLPYFRFSLCPEITRKAFLVALKVVLTVCYSLAGSNLQCQDIWLSSLKFLKHCTGGCCCTWWHFELQQIIIFIIDLSVENLRKWW